MLPVALFKKDALRTRLHRHSSRISYSMLPPYFVYPISMKHKWRILAKGEALNKLQRHLRKRKKQSLFMQLL